MYNPNNDFGLFKSTKVDVIHAINRNDYYDDLFALVVTPNWSAGNTYYYLVQLADEDADAIGHYWGILDPSDLHIVIREWIADAYFNINPYCFKTPNEFAEKRSDEWLEFFENIEIHWLKA